MSIHRSSAIGVALLLAGCSGKPDASGIYVASTDSEVAMIQLVQAQDGRVTGRFETIAVAPNGAVQTKNAEVDGSVSGHDLILRPASVWFGGVQASGSFTGSKLTLKGNGETLEAQRASLEKYQEAITTLKATSAKRRMAAAKQQVQDRIASSAAQLSQLTARLSTNTTKLSDALSRSPNFGALAAANTARIEMMVQRAPRLSSLARNQLAVSANQVEVETDQIDVARSQYAIQLNDIADDASRTMAAINKLCTNPFSELAAACRDAETVKANFNAVVQKGQASFTPYKAKVQTEMQRQNALTQKIED